MPLNFIFRQPKNELEKGGRTPVAATSDDMELAKQCPNCGNTDQSRMNVTRRTCGYLGENYWNEGKTKEIKARVMHL